MTNSYSPDPTAAPGASNLPDGGVAAASPAEDSTAGSPGTLQDANRTAEPVSELEAQVLAAIKTVYDPEIPVDIYELGLIYDVSIDEEKQHIDVAMTLTAPGCPVAGSMPEWVREAVESVDGIETARVDMVWEPPWTTDRMSMRAKLELNML